MKKIVAVLAIFVIVLSACSFITGEGRLYESMKSKYMDGETSFEYKLEMQDDEYVETIIANYDAETNLVTIQDTYKDGYDEYNITYTVDENENFTNYSFIENGKDITSEVDPTDETDVYYEVFYVYEDIMKNEDLNIITEMDDTFNNFYEQDSVEDDDKYDITLLSDDGLATYTHILYKDESKMENKYEEAGSSGYIYEYIEFK